MLRSFDDALGLMRLAPVSPENLELLSSLLQPLATGLGSAKALRSSLARGVLPLVVNGYLFASLDASLGNEDHADLIPDVPLLNPGVRFTTVIHEAARTAEELRVQEGALAELHEVADDSPLTVVCAQPLDKLVFPNDLSQILDHEGPLLDVLLSLQALPFPAGVENADLTELLVLDALVRTAGAQAAVTRQALNATRAVQAPFVVATALCARGKGAFALVDLGLFDAPGPRDPVQDLADLLKLSLHHCLATSTEAQSKLLYSGSRGRACGGS
mmetsp:Transcript_7519/g.28413  ORF Transcript_7519/g.28413 Transcript_7519/m.28413 type:complete len:273 (-) Transcript_7519:161-979(-)